MRKIVIEIVIEIGKPCSTMHKISSFYVESFESYRANKQTDKLTNKQTNWKQADATENIHLVPLRNAGG